MEKEPVVTVQSPFGPDSTQEPLKNKIMTIVDTSQIREAELTVTDQPRAVHPEIIAVAQLKPTHDFGGKTVLVVDDVAFNLTLIDRFFKNTGAQMLLAADGREALDACSSNPDVDIVLMDIQMPVMNGLDATREIRKIRPGLPVIAITAFVHSDDRQRCFDAGCNDFLSKPCSRADLLMMVSKYL